MQSEPENHRIALFVDIENMVGMANQLGLPADLRPVMERLYPYGRVIVRRAFGDLDAACNTGQSTIKRGTVRSMLYRSAFQLEDIPTLGRKNCADIRLTVETLSVAYCYPEIDTFAILASDRDYRPLVEKLREMGKTTIGIGGSATMTNAIYVQSCDVFIYYDNLFLKDGGIGDIRDGKGENGGTGEDALRTEERQRMLDEYCKLLVEGVGVFEAQGGRAVGGTLVPLIRSRRPDFDLSLVGLRTFRELAEEAQNRGLVTITPAGQDVSITLRRSANASPGVVSIVRPIGVAENRYPFQEQTLGETEASEAAVRFYSEVIARKLRAELLPKFLRDQAYDLTETILEKIAQPWENEAEPNVEKLPLDELSQRVTERLHLEDKLADQTAVFKLLYSLFRGGCFVCELTNHAYRPLILGLAPGAAEDLDPVFIRNTIRVLLMDDPHMPLLTEPLAAVFETEPDVIQAILDESGA